MVFQSFIYETQRHSIFKTKDNYAMLVIELDESCMQYQKQNLAYTGYMRLSFAAPCLSKCSSLVKSTGLKSILKLCSSEGVVFYLWKNC